METTLSEQIPKVKELLSKKVLQLKPSGIRKFFNAADEIPGCSSQAESIRRRCAISVSMTEKYKVLG